MMAWMVARPLQRLGISAFLLITGLLSVVSAKAALVENLTIGNPIALSLGNAVTADPPGVDSIYYNPAGLTSIRGREGLLKVAAVSLDFRVDFGSFSPEAQKEVDKWGQYDPVENSTSDTSTIMLRVPFHQGRVQWPGNVLVVPTGGAAYHPPGSRYTIGTAAFSPMAAGYKRGDNDPGRFMGKELSLVRITYFAPTIAIDLTDEFKVGFGINFSWQGGSALTELRVPNEAVAIVGTALQQIQDQTDCFNGTTNICAGVLYPFQRVADLEFDAETALSTNFNIGFLWKPTPWFTWGVNYQSEARNHMQGTYRFTYADSWVTLFQSAQQTLGGAATFLNLPVGRPVETGKAVVDMNIPQQFSTGISVQLTHNLKFNMDARWMDWGIWEGINVQFDQKMDFLKVASLLSPQYATATVLTIPRQYKSVWNFAFGAEYQYNDLVVLRAGWEPRKSSIRPASRMCCYQSATVTCFPWARDISGVRIPASTWRSAMCGCERMCLPVPVPMPILKISTPTFSITRIPG